MVLKKIHPLFLLLTRPPPPPPSACSPLSPLPLAAPAGSSASCQGRLECPSSGWPSWIPGLGWVFLLNILHALCFSLPYSNAQVIIACWRLSCWSISCQKAGTLSWLHGCCSDDTGSC